MKNLELQELTDDQLNSEIRRNSIEINYIEGMCIMDENWIPVDWETRKEFSRLTKLEIQLGQELMGRRISLE